MGQQPLLIVAVDGRSLSNMCSFLGLHLLYAVSMTMTVTEFANGLANQVRALIADPRELLVSGADVVAIRGLVDATDLWCSQLLTEFSKAGGHRVEGARDVSEWLARESHVRKTEGARRVSHIRVLEELPLFADAAAKGEITSTHIELLAKAVTSERFPLAVRDEQMLLGPARTFDASWFATVLQRWGQLCDDALNDPTSETVLHEKRRVQLTQLVNGMWKLDGLLDATVGQALDAALASAMPKPTTTEDTRTTGQRRHDALADLIAEFLSNDDRPVVGGQRPHVTIIYHDLDGSAHTPSGFYMSSLARDMIMCDCVKTKIGVNINGEPFYAGTPETDIPLKNRRAVIARDRCCRYPGCSRPARWSDIHHINERENGGTHELSNLVLMCRFHHRLIHKDKLKIEWAADKVTLLVTLGNGNMLTGPPHPMTIPSLFAMAAE
jgi:Domain of unknown function (DUF222)/HNH endonuclease